MSADETKRFKLGEWLTPNIFGCPAQIKEAKLTGGVPYRVERVDEELVTVRNDSDELRQYHSSHFISASDCNDTFFEYHLGLLGHS
jgi:hypothetical protein